MQQQIMIIGSSLESCKTLKYSLQDETTRAFYTLSPTDGIRYFIQYGYHLVVIDISSFDADVVRLLEQIKRIQQVPILVLSSCGEASHIVEILSIADDFLQKPFDIQVCKARINALLRRPTYIDKQDAPGVLSRDGTLLIDARCRKIYILNTEITLPRKQFELLYLMASNEGRVFSREQLQIKVWGYDFVGSENTLNCQIRELRTALKSISNAPEYIKTIRGVGYFFDTKADM